MNSLSKSQWFEPIPDSWSVQRMKNIMTPRDGRSFDGREELLSVTIQNGVIKRSQYLDDDEGGSRAESLVGYKIVHQDDLVNNIMKMSFRCLGVSPLDGIVSPAYSVFELNKEKVDPNYLNYQLRTDRYVFEYRKLSKGIQESRMRLYDDYFLSMRVIVPSIEEQKLISRYLDKKIEQIDCLVDKIQKKIDLLKEQRESLINQCITKGLDPNVEMKDSGVEWIGEIPKHWKISKYKYEITIQNGYPLKSELFDNEVGFPIIRIRDVTSGNIQTYYTGEIVDTHIVTNGDLLIGMDGDFNVRWWTGPKSLLNQRVCRVFEGNNYKRRYLYYLFPLQLNVINDLTYYTTVKHLSSFDILGTKTILPPISEQKEIIKKIDKITSKQDLLIEKNNFKILKLKEYRQSMISSIVTGKVRVTEDVI